MSPAHAIPSRLKLILFGVIVVVPAIVGLTSASIQFKHAKTVEFCGSCHVMEPYVGDLQNPESTNLAALHFQNRWIQKDQCYTCHTDYNFLGPPRAKLTGMRHVAAYYLTPEIEEIGLYKPFPNGNCLQCHEGTKKYDDVDIHEMFAEEIATGESSCVDGCHEPIHPDTNGPDGADVDADTEEKEARG